jgi:Mg2+ and Co2+ transporter CorA
MLYPIWAILVVPTFVVFSHYAMDWAHEDLVEVTNNDKLGLYIICAFLALCWPIVAVSIAASITHRYLNGNL